MNMKRLTILLVVTALLVGWVGCTGVNQTATQQMLRQTDNPVLIGKAAYFDVAGIYKDTAETYMRYKSILKSKYPDINARVVGLLNEMKRALDDWEALSGMVQIVAINDGSPDFQGKRRQIIFELAEFIEGGN
jgi:hypothetical protein